MCILDRMKKQVCKINTRNLLVVRVLKQEVLLGWMSSKIQRYDKKVD